MGRRKSDPEDPRPIAPDTVEIGEEDCPECGGLGEVQGEPCELCDGRGTIPAAV